MQRSERFAAFTVAAMTAPAFLVFPAIGAWSVVKVWPGMSAFDRALFSSAAVCLLIGLPIFFRRCLHRRRRYDSATPPITDRMLIAVPIFAGAWALNHQLEDLLVLTLLLFWDVLFKRTRLR